jgi:RNA polymerase sigma-70 factor (ECF subfamily)
LYSAYKKDIYNFILRISGYEYALAEELTQETFYRAFVSLSGFQGRCQIKTWLCQIAKNVYYQQLRKKKKEYQTLRSVFEEESGKCIAAVPESGIENAELIRRAMAIINSFDDRMRDVMLYRLYSDLPYAQISLLMGISEGSAKVVFFRGKALLQARLREEYGYEI